MDTLVSDIRFALRSLRKQRGLTFIAIVCLALGIGANTAIFSVVRAVLLESLPYGDPNRLVRVYETFAFQGQRGRGSVSVANYLDFRRDNRVFEDIAAYSAVSRDLVGGGQPERVRGIQASANLFRVLRVQPLAGRTFAADEDQPSRAPAVVLGEGFWRRRFGGDRRVIGQQISLDNAKHTVIGVMPASFDFPIGPAHTDIWVTLRWTERQAASRGNHWLQVVGRLSPGIDSTAATAQMSQIAARLARDYPDAQRDRGIEIVGMESLVVGRVRPALLMLLGAVGLVLLIACANVANLLLARASGRRREVAIRTALGAERYRLVRQFLTESILLAIAGGALGVGVAAWGLRGILGFAASSLPRADSIGLDPIVLGFAAVVSIGTGIAFGLVPALRATQTDLREDLTESAGRTSASRRQHRTLDALVVGEIALSLLLVVGAGLLVRGFVALLDTDIGLEPKNVLTFHAAAPAGRLSDSARYVGFYGPVLTRLRALPGVRSAAMINMLPIQNSGMNGYFRIVGRPPESDPSREPFAEFRVVSSGYFQTLGIAVKAGREFDDRDVVGAAPVVIVNDEFAKRYFPTQSPIGQQLFPWSDRPATIIGVVRSVRQTGIDREALSELYIPAAQNPGWLGDMTFVVSTERRPEALVPMARKAVQAVAVEQPLYLVQTMDRVIADWLRGRQLILVLLSVFAGLALLLSAAGVYGVMSYGVAQRTREIGIRVALGARRSDVTSMVLFDAAKLATLGIMIGVAAALGLTRVLGAMLYGVGARDPVTFAVVAALIGVVALLASAVPAMRAARVDPLQAMRAE